MIKTLTNGIKIKIEKKIIANTQFIVKLLVLRGKYEDEKLDLSHVVEHIFVQTTKSIDRGHTNEQNTIYMIHGDDVDMLYKKFFVITKFIIDNENTDYTDALKIALNQIGIESRYSKNDTNQLAVASKYSDIDGSNNLFQLNNETNIDNIQTLDIVNMIKKYYVGANISMIVYTDDMSLIDKIITIFERTIQTIPSGAFNKQKKIVGTLFPTNDVIFTNVFTMTDFTLIAEVPSGTKMRKMNNSKCIAFGSRTILIISSRKNNIEDSINDCEDTLLKMFDDTEDIRYKDEETDIITFATGITNINENNKMISYVMLVYKYDANIPTRKENSKFILNLNKREQKNKYMLPLKEYELVIPDDTKISMCFEKLDTSNKNINKLVIELMLSGYQLTVSQRNICLVTAKHIDGYTSKNEIPDAGIKCIPEIYDHGLKITLTCKNRGHGHYTLLNEIIQEIIEEKFISHFKYLEVYSSVYIDSNGFYLFITNDDYLKNNIDNEMACFSCIHANISIYDDEYKIKRLNLKQIDDMVEYELAGSYYTYRKYIINKNDDYIFYLGNSFVNPRLTTYYQSEIYKTSNGIYRVSFKTMEDLLFIYADFAGYERDIYVFNINGIDGSYFTVIKFMTDCMSGTKTLNEMIDDQHKVEQKILEKCKDNRIKEIIERHATFRIYASKALNKNGFYKYPNDLSNNKFIV